MPDQKSSTDLARLYQLYLSQPTQERLDELLKHCLKLLDKRVFYWVNARGFCPASLHPSTFAQDAFSRAKHKFWVGIHALRSPKALASWTNRVARSAVVEELQKVVRRTKEPCSFGPLELEYPDGTVTHVLDHPENRTAATRYGCITVEEAQLVKQVVYRDLLGKLFRAAENWSERQREGVEFLRLMLDHDLTADEIADQRGMRKSVVQNRLRMARKKLREVAEIKFDFTAEDL